jgi:flagellum-specific ATP synthase
MTVLAGQIDTLRRMRTRQVAGSVTAVRGLTVLAEHLPVPVGSLVHLTPGGDARLSDDPPIGGEVIGFDDGRAIIMLFDNSVGVAPGMRVLGLQARQSALVGQSMLGRVIDGLGRPIDDGGPLRDLAPVPLNPAPTCSLKRKRITEPLPTGVRSLDAMITLGKGQRMGVFSGPGVGKSTMLATVARNTAADVNVIALVGERGKEVRDFIETALGDEGLARSVLVVATSDESPLIRVRAALLACSIAEYYRELGADVMLMMDSVTRLAQAQRQIGLNVGEQPATKGYTPSVFALLPRLLERAGALEGGGSITGLYAVLVEGDDLNEPISDAARGILDGHVALSRKLASKGHYPAVDVLESISRVADDVCDQPHIAARRTIRRLVAAYAEAEELINIGAYARGSNRDCDIAIEMKPQIDGFLQQLTEEKADYPLTCRTLIELSLLADTLGEQRDAVQSQPAQAQGRAT